MSKQLVFDGPESLRKLATVLRCVGMGDGEGADFEAEVIEAAADCISRLREQGPQLRALYNKVADDDLADAVARDCHDPAHNAAWCGTCMIRSDAIEAYRDKIGAAITTEIDEPGETDLARAAARAAMTGDRKDVVTYLRLRDVEEGL